MGMSNKGKAWEEQFKSNWKKCFPNTFILRLRDSLNGYKETSQNPCDFICMPRDELFLIECKEHKGASIPFQAIPQYSRLLSYKGLLNTRPGVLIWFSEHDIVIWVPVEEMEKMINNGEKSIGIRMLDKKMYNIIVLPAEKKRVFLDVDYTVLVKE